MYKDGPCSSSSFLSLFLSSSGLFFVNPGIFLFSLIFLNFLDFSVIFNVFRTDCFYIFGF